MVEEACQTDAAESLSQRIMSFSDVCHAVQHDHNYACIDDTVLGKKSASLTEDSKAKRALHFRANESADHREKVCVKEEFETEWLSSDMSDSEESEISDSESEFNIQDEESDGNDSEWDDGLVMKKEDPEEVKKEHRNWLDENCADIQEKCKFIVFESKMKELFAHHVRCQDCGKNVQAAKLTTKGSVATIDCHGCCEQPVHWQTQPFVRSMGAGNLLLSAGILFTGNDFSNFASVAKATNLQIFSERNFTSTQRKYLFPVVNKNFKEHQGRFLTMLEIQRLLQEEMAAVTVPPTQPNMALTVLSTRITLKCLIFC